MEIRLTVTGAGTLLLLGLGAVMLRKKMLKFLIFQWMSDILLKMRLSDVAEQEYKMLYGKSQIKEQHNGKEC